MEMEMWVYQRYNLEILLEFVDGLNVGVIKEREELQMVEFLF